MPARRGRSHLYGSQYNIIPDCVEMEGTIRSVDSGVRMAVAQRIEQIAAAQAAVFGADAQCIIDWGAPPVINDESMAHLAAEAAKEITGEECTVTHLVAPNMGGEDFAYYLEKLPGAYLFLSSANGAKTAPLRTTIPALTWMRMYCTWVRRCM